MLCRASFLSMTQVPDPSAGGEVTSDAPDLLTVGEVAERFRVSDETIHRWCRVGRLEYVTTPGGQKRFRRGYIDRLANGYWAA